MKATNELLYYLNRFNFNELSQRGYSPLEKENFPFLWVKDNKIILPKPKISPMKDFTKSHNEDFFPLRIKEMNANLQKRFFVNYFISVAGREDVHWEFNGFSGFNFIGEAKYYGFWVNSPLQIENLTLSSSLGIKNIFRPEKGIFLFGTDASSSIPESDSRLESLERYVLGLKEVFDTKMHHKIREGKAVISRYHPTEQQLQFIDFLQKLEPASAEKVLDAYGGDFFKAYVVSPY